MSNDWQVRLLEHYDILTSNEINRHPQALRNLVHILAGGAVSSIEENEDTYRRGTEVIKCSTASN